MSYDPNEIENLTDSELWEALGEEDSREKAMVMMEIGSRALGKREWSDAITMAEQASGIAKDIGDTRFAADCMRDAAFATYRSGDVNDAIDRYQRTIDLYHEVGAQRDMADAYCRIASLHIDENKYSEALEAAKSGYQFASNEDAGFMMAWSKFFAGKALYFLDHEQESLDTLHEARTLFRNLGEAPQVAMVDDFAAKVHEFLGNFDEAVTLLRSCVHIAEATKDSEDDPYSLFRLGCALYAVDRFKEAIETLQRSQTAYRAQDRLWDVAACEKYIADCLDFSGQEAEALASFERAQALFDGRGDDYQVRYCEMRRSQILHELGNYAASERLTRRLYNDVLADIDTADYGYLYWVALHQAGNLLMLERYQDVIDLTDSLNDERADPTPRNLAWKHTMRARAFTALDQMHEALVEVEAGLAATDNDTINSETAFLYQIRAGALLSENNKSGERDLAHAIAIHLASGEDDRARDLAQYFMPSLNRAEASGLTTIDADTEIAQSDPNGYPFGFSTT